MQTDEAFWAEFDQAFDNYTRARAKAGFPITKPEHNAPLPSWVMRNNERPKMTFVTRQHTAAPAPAKSVQPVAAPVEAKPVEAAAEAKPASGQSFAAQVRAIIADVKPKGWTQEQLVEHAVTVLNMKRTSAINCVKHNWDRVKG